MAFAEDLAPFFATSDFGSAATIGAATVNGILDTAYLEPLGNAVQGNAPVFLCRTADVASIAHGTSIVIAGVTYKVRGVEPDGTGVTLLRLEKQ